ncbi:Golgi-associated plant pathogenesis-related 1 [Brachionus plicatilis]|uniref:Golgi-associated plant pathogenesis-related 1 n=1 Tax=Brachionus plicatilis TaxID=10195 RepID=A0A3M7PVJ6_BRAPC|nr:Golgi-associated plant pathogenesis-related 1 [Brachionus plicatilis]
MNESIKEILEIAEKVAGEKNQNQSNDTNNSNETEITYPKSRIKIFSLAPRFLYPRHNLMEVPKIKCFQNSPKFVINPRAYINEAFDAHNECRHRHGFEPLIQNLEIAFIAQQYANQMAKSGCIAHSNSKYLNQDLGENLYSFDYRDPSVTGKRITREWYNEMYQYKFTGAQCGTGHFTQLIWKSTKEVGFGIAFSTNGRAYFVANYFPTGNIIGKFAENVNQPLN